MEQLGVTTELNNVHNEGKKFLTAVPWDKMLQKTQERRQLIINKEQMWVIQAKKVSH